MKQLKVMLNGAEKVVEFKDIYTRKIDREFNDILFKNVNASSIANGGKDLSLNPTDIQTAQDYLISAMTNLTAEEVDALAMNDYQTILETVSKIKNPPQQTQAS